MKKKYLSFLLLSFPLITLAQEKNNSTDLKEVIVSENRIQTPFSKLARNIQIISKEEISQLPAKSINEVLSFIAGIDIRQRGPFGTQADVSIDGGTFEQTLILLNGMKISDVQTAHHSLNIPIPLAAIERIEVLKGPAARIYGINALTGAINIVTKTSDKSGVNVVSQVGTAFKNKDINEGNGIYSGGEVQTVLQLASNKFQNLIAVSTQKSNGQRYNSSTQNSKLFYQGDFTINDKNKLNLMGGYIDNAFGASGYYAAPNDKEAYELVKTAIAGISSKHQITEHFSISPRFSSRYNWDDYRYYRNNLSKARSQHRTGVYSGEINSNLTTNFGEFGFGIESRSENIKSTNIGNKQRYNHGVYTEFKTESITNIILNLGAYLNYNTQYGWQAYPGIDAAYLFTKDWKLALNLGTSQRIPSFTDLYLKQAPANIGNANLKSENAWQYELNIQHQTKDFKWSAGYFYRDITNFIDWLRASNTVPYQPQNLGVNKTHGLQTSIYKNIDLGNENSLKIGLQYQYLNASKNIISNNLTSKYALEHLKHQLITTVNYKLNKWNFNISNRWLERNLKKNYNITDFRVKFEDKKWALFTEINNIFDEKYIEVAAVPLPSRWFTLGAELHLNW